MNTISSLIEIMDNRNYIYLTISVFTLFIQGGIITSYWFRKTITSDYYLVMICNIVLFPHIP